MKKLLNLLLVALIPALALAQPVTVGKRNDNSATVLQGTNLGNSFLATDSKGRAIVTASTPVPVDLSAQLTPIPVVYTPAPIPAGSNTIGSIANITTSVVPGTGNTNLGIAEDQNFADGRTVVGICGQRSDSISVQTSNNGDCAVPIFDQGSRQIVTFFTSPGSSIQATNAAAITNTSSTQIVAAIASTRIYVVDLSITNESAVPSRIDILDGSTVIWRAFIPANSYYQHNFNVPLRGSSNTALNVQVATTATSTFVSITGFTASV